MIDYAKWKKKNNRSDFNKNNDKILGTDSIILTKSDFPIISFRIFDGISVANSNGGIKS